MKQVMPVASPSLPLVRAKTMTCVATCMPVVHIFSPLISQPGLPSFSCGRRGLHEGRVGAVVGLGQAEAGAHACR